MVHSHEDVNFRMYFSPETNLEPCIIALDMQFLPKFRIIMSKMRANKNCMFLLFVSYENLRNSIIFAQISENAECVPGWLQTHIC